MLDILGRIPYLVPNNEKRLVGDRNTAKSRMLRTAVAVKL
jgi:hypothetical protein